MHHNKEPESFSIDGHLVVVEFKPLSSEAIGSIRDAIRKDDFFGAEIRLIAGSIDRLTHDGKTIIRPQNRAARRGGTDIEAESIPGDYDEKTDELLIDRLVKLCVKRTPWLTRKKPFSAAFELYADEDTPEKDPTKFPAEVKKVS
jgi:hypothetical protein